MRVCCFAMAAVTLFALGLSGLTASAALAARNDAASEKLGLKLSLQCYTFRKLSFFETVDKAAAMGIKYLELYPGQQLKPGSKETTTSNMSDETCQAIQAKLAEAGGLKLVAYGVASVPTDEAAARKVFDWAKKMGIEVLVTETTPTAVHDKLCTEYNIRMALHNHPKTWPPEQVMAACKERCKLIGSCCDTGHWMRANHVPVDTMKIVEGRIMHLHFKDLDQFGMKGQDVPWGTGNGNVKGMLEELKRQGFHGYLSIEYEHGSVDDLLTNLPKCIAFFDQTTTDLAQ